MIAESLRNQNSVLPAGSIDTRGDRVLVRVSGQFASLDDIRNVPITAGGRTIKLGDFTTVTRGFEDPPTYTVRHNGQQVLMLGIVMTDDGNIVDLGKAIEKRSGQDPGGAAVRCRARARRRSARPRSASRSGSSSARCSKRSPSCSP